MNYGEFVNFECRSRDDYNILQLYLGETQVFTDINVFDSLTAREISTDVRHCHCPANETIGTIWILINNRTIPLIRSFWCRAIGYHNHEDSKKGYIHVIYPECTSTQHNISSFIIEPTLSTITFTSLALAPSPTLTSLKLPHGPCGG